MHHSSSKRIVLTVLSLLALAGTSGGEERGRADPALPGDARLILTIGSPWRWYIAWRKPIVPVAAMRAAGHDASEPAVLPVKVAWSQAGREITHLETDPPPTDWMRPGYNDRDWPRARGPFQGRARVMTGLICLRGRFAVADPNAVKALHLSMTYRGGAVVYLNGREVVRVDLPEGPITPATPARPYPDEAFVGSDGRSLPHPAKAKQEQARYAKRVRRIGPVELPTKALRSGANVLAIELHRSDFHPAAMTWWNTPDYMYGRPLDWNPIGLIDLRLHAVGTGIAPTLHRPTGVQVWNIDVHDRLDGIDFADPGDSPRPILLTGARNGVYAGAVVASSTEPLRDLKGRVGELVKTGGPGSIPRSAIHVRYVLPSQQNTGSYRPIYAFDVLADEAPAEALPAPANRYVDQRKRIAMGLAPRPMDGPIQPIWVTVEVPRDAAAGDYRGVLTISARDIETVEVPIHLQVADWTLPDPLGFRTHVSTYQSPTSVAMQYGVKEWSEEHWALMEKSFVMLGQLGNDLVNVLVVDQTQFGNDEGMVYWVKRADGKFDYDFSVFDRYLALAKKHLGTPRFVALQVWHSGGWETRKANQKNTVTVIDPKSGRRERMQVPVFGTKESEAFWRSALMAIKARLAKAGLEKSMCLGILSDGTAPPEVFAMFNRIIPDVGWTRGNHPGSRSLKPVPLRGGGKIVLWEFVYGHGIQPPGKGLPRIWEMTGPGVAFFRGDFDWQPLLLYRATAERSLYTRNRGFGRNGLDYWNVMTGRNRKWANIYNRYPHSSCAHRRPTMNHLAHPGPDGPMATTRFELLREGLQEAEAVIFVAEALDQHADALGPELAETCRRVFVERIDFARRIHGVRSTAPFYTGWQDRSARLYETAARVARALGKR